MKPRSSRATTPSQPVGARLGADEDEHASAGTRLRRRPASRIAQRLQMRRPRPRPRRARVPRAHRRCSGAPRSARPGSATWLLAATARARASSRWLGVAGEVHRRLPGRVRAADDEHVLVRARPRLGQRRAVVDARAGQRVDARARRAGGTRRPWRPARVWRSARRRRCSTTSRSAPSSRRPTASCTRQHLGAEAARLGGRPARQVARR